VAKGKERRKQWETKKKKLNIFAMLEAKDGGIEAVNIFN